MSNCSGSSSTPTTEHGRKQPSETRRLYQIQCGSGTGTVIDNIIPTQPTRPTSELQPKRGSRRRFREPILQTISPVQLKIRQTASSSTLRSSLTQSFPFRLERLHTTLPTPTQAAFALARPALVHALAYHVRARALAEVRVSKEGLFKHERVEKNVRSTHNSCWALHLSRERAIGRFGVAASHRTEQ